MRKKAPKYSHNRISGLQSDLEGFLDLFGVKYRCTYHVAILRGSKRSLLITSSIYVILIPVRARLASGRVPVSQPPLLTCEPRHTGPCISPYAVGFRPLLGDKFQKTC